MAGAHSSGGPAGAVGSGHGREIPYGRAPLAELLLDVVCLHLHPQLKPEEAAADLPGHAERAGHPAVADFAPVA